jgi:hypothetical protein
MFFHCPVPSLVFEGCQWFFFHSYGSRRECLLRDLLSDYDQAEFIWVSAVERLANVSEELDAGYRGWSSARRAQFYSQGVLRRIVPNMYQCNFSVPRFVSAVDVRNAGSGSVPLCSRLHNPIFVLMVTSDGRPRLYFPVWIRYLSNVITPVFVFYLLISFIVSI